jgi:hypothetical protein
VYVKGDIGEESGAPSKKINNHKKINRCTWGEISQRLVGRPKILKIK